LVPNKDFSDLLMKQGFERFKVSILFLFLQRYKRDVGGKIYHRGSVIEAVNQGQTRDSTGNFPITSSYSFCAFAY
jgi:hypothetical protein